MATSEAGKSDQMRPVLGTPDDLPDRPESPARPGRVVVHLVIGVLVAIVAGGWGYVMWSSTGQTEVINQVITFNVDRSDVAEITYEIHKPSDRAALCRLRATDVNHMEVGTREVTIPAGEAYARRSDQVRISARATSVSVHYCYLV